MTMAMHTLGAARILARRRRWMPAILLLAFALSAHGQSELDCIRCHGDRELLSQQTGSVASGQRLWIDHPAYLQSTHSDFDCFDCHDGVEQFPHALEKTSSMTCLDCHELDIEHLETSSHFREDNTLECGACHGVHDVHSDTATIDTRCHSCHSNIQRPEADPHTGNLYCSDCHGSHQMQAVMTETDASRFSACEDCHDDVAESWERDVHGSAKLGGATNGRGVSPASCIDCHGSHDILYAKDPGFHLRTMQRCEGCHPEATASAENTYHIKATTLGSEIVAACSDCHGAHDVYPASREESWVSEGRILETCQKCHPYAEAKFALYQPHPDPRSRAKNPVVFYSFWFMNILLVGVLGVFLLHTAVWWLRIGIDARRGEGHGHG